MSVTIDPVSFSTRLKRLLQIISKSTSFDAISIPVGKYDQSLVTKSVTLFNYLFGIEFTDTILFFTSSEIHIFSSKKKIDRYFRPGVSLVSNLVHFHVLSKKDESANRKTIETALTSLSDVSTVGLSSKDRSHCSQGSIFPTFVEVEKKVFSSSDSLKDGASRCIAELLSRKDAKELDCVKRSGAITSKLFRNGLIDMLEDVIDQDTKITHADLSEKVESLIDHPKKIKAKYDPEEGMVEIAISPVIQSGGKWDVRFNAQSDKEPLKHDVIPITLGCRYNLYSTKICRTIFVDAGEKIKANYASVCKAYVEFELEAQEYICDSHTIVHNSIFHS